jgi:hypothetical protein
MTEPTIIASSAPPTGRTRTIAFVVALLWVAAVIGATMQQGVLHHNNNFLIFRAASWHLLHGQDLYAAYPAEHLDYYKYSPTFALLFLPFALPPFWLAMLLWNALNAAALYFAIGTVLPLRPANIARAIVFLDMLGSLQNAQSNALVAALIIVTFAAYERRHTVIGSVSAMLGAMIKIFPLVGVTFALFHGRKARVAAALGVSAVVLAVLPLLVTSPVTLRMQYASWKALSAMDALTRGFSVMEMVHLLARSEWPNWPIQLAGALLLVAPVLLQPARHREWHFRRLYLCSVLLFCLIFNHKAESPAFVIGVAGAAIWFAALERRSEWEWTLFGLIVVFTILASSDAMPRVLQRNLFDPYRLKVVPLIVLWGEVQRRLWREGNQSCRGPVRRSSTTSPFTTM